MIHTLTEGNGMPLANCTTAANGSEREQIIPLLDSVRLKTLKKRCDPDEVSSSSGQTPARFPRYGNTDQERERAPRQGRPKKRVRVLAAAYWL